MTTLTQRLSLSLSALRTRSTLLSTTPLSSTLCNKFTQSLPLTPPFNPLSTRSIHISTSLAAPPPRASDQRSKAPTVNMSPLDPDAIYRLRVTLTSNNTFLNLSDPDGKTKVIVTLGMVNKEGGGMKTAYLSQVAAADKLGSIARERGVHKMEVVFKGYNKNCRAIMKGLTKYKFRILSIKNETPIPFNGTRPRKQRRL